MRDHSSGNRALDEDKRQPVRRYQRVRVTTAAAALAVALAGCSESRPAPGTGAGAGESMADPGFGHVCTAWA